MVGLKSGLHTGAVMLEGLPAHAVRLAQCSEIQLDLRAATSAPSIRHCATVRQQWACSSDVFSSGFRAHAAHFGCLSRSDGC